MQTSGQGDCKNVSFTPPPAIQDITHLTQINHHFSIYSLHDKAKDKEFELELSWVCDESNKQHIRVPKDVFAEAQKFAIDSTKEEDASEDEEIDNIVE